MPKRNIVWIIAIFAVAGVIVWVTRNVPTIRQDEPSPIPSVEWTYRRILQDYYRSASERGLRRAAVRGMVESLDEFSTYVPPDQVEEFRRRLEGDGRGIGLRVEVADGKVVVIGPLVNSPALRAGIAAGDRILAIDEKLADGMSVDEVRLLLRGPIGTAVALRLLRRDGREETIRLLRGEYALETVTGLLRGADGLWDFRADPDARIAYVRVTEFVKLTRDQLADACQRLGAVRGLVLDLRDNPGGMLEAAVAVADWLLSEGMLVEVVSRTNGNRVFHAHTDATYPADIPMVVLINEQTASAAEIVAGALRVHHRAVLVGTRSLGKGCVQTMIALPDDLGQINLTTKVFLLGDGRPINRVPGSDVWGVDPHFQVVLGPVEQKRLRRMWARAEVVVRPRTTTLPTQPSEDWRRRRIAVDRPLAQALELLQEPGRIHEILEHARRRAVAATGPSGSGGHIDD